MKHMGYVSNWGSHVFHATVQEVLDKVLIQIYLKGLSQPDVVHSLYFLFNFLSCSGGGVISGGH